MLTDPKLRSQVDQLWDKLWTGGLTNPLDAIEQLSYLIFLKRLDDEEDRRERQAQRRGLPYQAPLAEEMRWRHWTHFQAAPALEHLKTKVFPRLRELGQEGSSFERYMQNAEFKINKPSLLIEACKMIDQMALSAQNQDVQGDLYEYLLSKLNTAGRNGQFRTPRHIIRMMVKMLDPQPGERIGDLAAGTCGFLVNAYQHILERHTSPGILSYDAQGEAHNLVGDQLSAEQRAFLQNGALRGYDNDSGMTMLRIGSMNLMLHGVDYPQFYYTDTLSKGYSESRAYDVILMNPPFTGAVDQGDVSDTLPGDTRKSELLFVHLILRALDMGGRCAVIVPDGVLFGSSNAHIALRKKLVEENRLDGVVSMPGGVFKPYAGVSTAVLLFTRGATTERIWFYDMAHDGFSLDDKRQPTTDNDIPDLLACWRNRHTPEFQGQQQAEVERLKAELTPLKTDRLAHQAAINRLTFESVIQTPGVLETPGVSPLEQAKAELAELEAKIAPLQRQLDQLTRQFWVSKQAVVANKYDLSASRYRQIENELFVSESREMLSKIGLENGRFVEPGSILVVCIAGSATTIGNVALTNRRVAFNQQINSVTPNKDVDPIFLHGLFRVAKPLVQRSTTLGMKRIITKSKFEELFLIKPPLPLQQKFAQVVQKYERLRAQQRESARQGEHLFQSLLHRAFRGEI